jgi:hypothetical protein
LVNALAQAQSRGLWRDMVLLLDDRLRNLQAASDGANAAPAFPADAPLAPFAPAFEAENGTDETGPGIEAAAQADRTYGDALHAALLPAMQLLAWADALSADSSAPADVLSAAPAALSFTPSAMAERILQFGDMPQTLGDLIAALADEPIFDEALSGDTDGSDISARRKMNRLICARRPLPIGRLLRRNMPPRLRLARLFDARIGDL